MPQRALLLSLKPKYAQAIYEGRKTLEFRRRPPRCAFPIRAFIYETLPVGRVTGFVMIVALRDAAPGKLEDLVPGSDPLHADYAAYLRGASHPVALVLGAAQRFAAAMALAEAFGAGVTAPQSYRFVDEARLAPLLAG